MKKVIVLPYTRKELEADINKEDKELFDSIVSEYKDKYPDSSVSNIEIDDLDYLIMNLHLIGAELTIIYFDAEGNYGRGQALSRLLSYTCNTVYIRDSKKVVFKGGVKYEKNTLE